MEKKNFEFFGLRIFPKIKKKNCEQILWGSSPQIAHTDELKFDIILWRQSWSPLENRMSWKKIELYNVITKFSARRALPDNDQMYSVNENTQTTKQTELKAPDSGQTPAVGPRLPPRWSLFLHFLSCKAGVGAPPVSRFLAYMSEKKNFERSPKPSYEFF